MDAARMRCFLLRNPTALDFHAYMFFKGQTIEQLELWELNDGAVISEDSNSDLHCLLEKNGRCSLFNVTVTMPQLKRVIEARRKRELQPFRTFVWLDARSSATARSALFDLLIEQECGSVYVVGTKTSSSGKKKIRCAGF